MRSSYFIHFFRSRELTAHYLAPSNKGTVVSSELSKDRWKKLLLLHWIQGCDSVNGTQYYDGGLKKASSEFFQFRLDGLLVKEKEDALEIQNQKRFKNEKILKERKEKKELKELKKKEKIEQEKERVRLLEAEEMERRREENEGKEERCEEDEEGKEGYAYLKDGKEEYVEEEYPTPRKDNIMGIDTARKDSDDLDASRQDPLLDTYKVLTGRRE